MGNIYLMLSINRPNSPNSGRSIRISLALSKYPLIEYGLSLLANLVFAPSLSANANATSIPESIFPANSNFQINSG